MATLLLAAGLDPEVCTLFVQSHVPEHSQLGWIMECTAPASASCSAWCSSRTSRPSRSGFISAGLLTYPALQAADILLYDADRVPVGDDQRQHLELTRDVAIRFNSRYGDTFVVPEPTPSRKAGARVMDLQDPTAKMSKSTESPQGTVLVLDPPEVDRAQVQAGRHRLRHRGRLRPRHQAGRVEPAVDPGRGHRHHAGGRGRGHHASTAPLKAAVGDAVVEVLRPLQERYAELSADPGEVDRLLAVGADKARAVAAKTLARAQHALGLLAPG